MSVSGTQVFTHRHETAPLVIPQNGGVAVSGAGGRAVSTARFNALRVAARNGGRSNQVVVDGAASVMDQALVANATANPILTGDAAAGIQTASRSAARCSTPASRSSCGRSRG